MKKFVGGFLMVLALAFVILPGAALAQKQSGVYVAPRFIYGLTDMDRMQRVDPDEGKSKMNSDTDSAFGGAFAVGYNFNPKFKVPMRAELEYSAFSKTEGERNFFNKDSSYEYAQFTQEVSIQTIMVNFYYDEKTSTPLTPYLTAGLGIAINKSKAEEDHFFAYGPGSADKIYINTVKTPEETDINFAWQVGLGLAYDFTPSFSMDIGYRYMDLGSAKTKRINNGQYVKVGDITMHQFHMGARYSF